MTDLAPLRRTDAAGLADAERREVVVQHERFAVLAADGVHKLRVAARPQCRDHHGLGLATGEQGRAMRARQEADHRLDRADLVELAAVDAAAVLEDRAANDVGFDLLDHLAGGHLRLAVCVGVMTLDLVARAVERVRAGVAGVVEEEPRRLAGPRVLGEGRLEPLERREQLGAARLQEPRDVLGVVTAQGGQHLGDALGIVLGVAQRLLPRAAGIAADDQGVRDRLRGHRGLRRRPLGARPGREKRRRQQS